MKKHIIYLILIFSLSACSASKYRYFNVCEATETIGVYNQYKGGTMIISKENDLYQRICSFLARPSEFKKISTDLKVHTKFIPFEFFNAKNEKVLELHMVLHNTYGWILVDNSDRYQCNSGKAEILMAEVDKYTVNYNDAVGE